MCTWLMMIKSIETHSSTETETGNSNRPSRCSEVPKTTISRPRVTLNVKIVLKVSSKKRRRNAID